MTGLLVRDIETEAGTNYFFECEKPETNAGATDARRRFGLGGVVVAVGLCNPVFPHVQHQGFETDNFNLASTSKEWSLYEFITQAPTTLVDKTQASRVDIGQILSNMTGDIPEDTPVYYALKKEIETYGEPSVQVIDEWMQENSKKHTTTAEIMRFLGVIDDPATKSARLELLAKGLKNSSPLVRDSAALGLEDMNDIRAVSFLTDAIASEPYESLRDDYQMIIESLEG